MTIFFSIVFTLLIIALITVLVVLMRQTKTEQNEKLNKLVKQILDKKIFKTKKIFYTSNELTFALNEDESKLAVIEDIDFQNPEKSKYYTINTNFITQIEKNSSLININYIKNGNTFILSIPAKNKEIEASIHAIFKNACVKKLANKYMVKTFQYTTSSDWECSYVWAYSPIGSAFAYYKTTEKKAIYKLNILKNFFTIDVKFNYFEAPVLGIAQELDIYDVSFLNDIFLSLLGIIKQKYSTVYENRIYYDSYYEAVYLTNGSTTLQSILLSETEEVYYKDDRLTFSLKGEDKTINFIADKLMLEEFENFITSYNLRKIANSFDYNSDKLINTTQGTKFIVDYSRDRVVYCAGLNSLSKFSYIIIMFSNLESATIEKNKDNYFVRIHTKDRNIIDVSCNKSSIAQYILAQITTIKNL